MNICIIDVPLRVKRLSKAHRFIEVLIFGKILSKFSYNKEYLNFRKVKVKNYSDNERISNANY